MKIRIAMIFIFLFAVALMMSCSSTASKRQLIKIEDANNFNFDKLVKLSITEGPESKRPRTNKRIVSLSESDLYVRGEDAEGNLYILPKQAAPAWTTMSVIDYGMAQIGKLNWSNYPERVYDAATTEEIRSHGVRIILKKTNVPSPLVFEARLGYTGPNGQRMLTGRIQLDIVQSSVRRMDISDPAGNDARR